MMIAKKYSVANVELLRREHKNDRLFLYIGAFVIITIGFSIFFLLRMAFLKNFGGDF
jgi:hypothetical protein